MKYKFLILLLCVIVSTGCSVHEKSLTADTTDIELIIWDPEEFLQTEPLAELTAELSRNFETPVIIHERLSENTTSIIENEFRQMPETSVCIFMVISGRPGFHFASEWNLWMPRMWRELDCRGKILIADAPWADEYLNPLKTVNPESIWAVNGRISNLRKKLPGSMLAASCRFDEVNILTRGLGSKEKLPLFSVYFFQNLKNAIESVDTKFDLVRLLENTAEQTASARERGIISDLEETLFFNRSEIHEEEFRSFPHPLIWNGLADEVLIRKVK